MHKIFEENLVENLFSKFQNLYTFRVEGVFLIMREVSETVKGKRKEHMFLHIFSNFKKKNTRRKVKKQTVDSDKHLKHIRKILSLICPKHI